VLARYPGLGPGGVWLGLAEKALHLREDRPEFADGSVGSCNLDVQRDPARLSLLSSVRGPLLQSLVPRTTIGALFPAASEVIMRSGRHFVEWQGERYTAEPLKSLSPVTSLSPVWAVARRGEFIGTLPYRPQETTKEFEIRCIAWLCDLYGAWRS